MLLSRPVPHIALALLCLTGIFACCSPNKQQNTNGKVVTNGKTAQVKDTVSLAAHQLNYEKLCARIETKRKAFAKEYAACTDSSVVEKKAAAYLQKILIDSVFVYWYDTPWDFNGVTQKPRQGNIACGYFVTTTLKQSGVPLQRVWMAQQASSVMINKLCEKSNVKTISNNQLSKLKTYLLAQEDGLWIIGLDNHTGFVVKKGTTLDFVHACYNPVKYVRRETLENSPIIKSSGLYMVGKVFAGRKAIRAWISGDGEAIKGQ